MKNYQTLQEYIDDVNDLDYGIVQEDFISDGTEQYEDWGELNEEDNEGRKLNKPFLSSSTIS